jgi:ElaB/YqjD/DUF883 family membrane-anchored ribosome-binding protein
MAIRSLAPGLNEKSNEDAINTPCATDDVAGKAKELASAVVQKTQDVAAGASQKAHEWAGSLADKAQDTASKVAHKTDDGIAAVGQKMNALGGKVRDAAPHNGALGAAATVVADNLQASGEYLEGHGLGAIGKDLTEMVKKHPISSILIGFGVGCLLGMTLLQRRS